jgi:phosphoglycerol transferase MdoB-like AlkP superfamily enzyme
MYQTRVRSLLLTLCCQLLWLVLLLMSARYVMQVHFLDSDQLAGRGNDLQRMWITGLRYDLRVAGMALAPFVLAGLILAAFAAGWRRFRAWAPPLLGVVGFLFAATAIVNFYYYQTYHNHIDLFVFGATEEGAKAVAANMWQDYPLVRVVLAIAGLACVPLFLARWTLKREPESKWPAALFVPVLVVFLAMFFVACRGSIGTFPLRRGNASVSDLMVLNKLTPNGVIAIDWAIKDHKDDTRMAPVSRGEGERLMAAAGITELELRTPPNPWLAENKPHVMLALMESFGSNMLEFDVPGKNDMLGALRPHVERDFFFKRFVSEGNGTAETVAGLFFQSPVQSISHGKAQKTKLAGNPFAIFKDAGYKVVFITPGNLMWRNMSNYLKTQGVDELHDQNTLINRYPEAAGELAAWGIPDDYAFRLAAELLKNAEQPLFITILTVMNHPPYLTPGRYKARPTHPTEDFLAHTEEGGISREQMLKTYQFACNALGLFIDDIDASGLGGRTVIAATGDHHMRRLKAFYPSESALHHAVPFYLRVPETIRSQVPWKYDRARVGSHKDILPTIYHYSLADTPYLAIAGRNMLAPVDDETRAFGYNMAMFVDSRGAYPVGKRAVFYPWKDSTSLMVADRPGTADEAVFARHKAFPKLLHWQLQSRACGFVEAE